MLTGSSAHALGTYLSASGKVFCTSIWWMSWVWIWRHSWSQGWSICSALVTASHSSQNRCAFSASCNKGGTALLPTLPSLNSDQFKNQCVKFVPLKARHLLASGSLFAFGAGDSECEGIQKSPHTGETLLHCTFTWERPFLHWIPWPKWCSLQPSTYHKLSKFEAQWGEWGEGVNFLDPNPMTVQIQPGHHEADNRNVTDLIFDWKDLGFHGFLPWHIHSAAGRSVRWWASKGSSLPGYGTVWLHLITKQRPYPLIYYQLIADLNS